MKASTLLKRARKHLAYVGLNKGSMYHPASYLDGRHPRRERHKKIPCCAYGAIDWAFLDKFSMATYNAAEDALDEVARELGCTYAPDYNDRPDTTLDDVLTMFDKAIGRLEARGS